MSINAPLISIITATYNSLKFFEETKCSVFTEGIQDFEWIIIDDGSSDGTKKILLELQDPRVKLHLKDLNTGIGDSYEIGIGLAQGKYLLILDHDDTIPEGTLSKRVEWLERNSTANVAFGTVAYMDEYSKIYNQSNFPLIQDSCVLPSSKVLLGIFASPAYPLKQGCVVLRSNFVMENRGIYDIALFLQAVISGPVVFINEPCLNYRTFRNQYSSSRKKRVMTFLHFYWAKYSLQYLPWYFSPIVAVYRTSLELAKVLWCFVSSKR